MDLAAAWLRSKDGYQLQELNGGWPLLVNAGEAVFCFNYERYHHYEIPLFSQGRMARLPAIWIPSGLSWKFERGMLENQSFLPILLTSILFARRQGQIANG